MKQHVPTFKYFSNVDDLGNDPSVHIYLIYYRVPRKHIVPQIYLTGVSYKDQRRSRRRYNDGTFSHRTVNIDVLLPLPDHYGTWNGSYLHGNMLLTEYCSLFLAFILPIFPVHFLIFPGKRLFSFIVRRRFSLQRRQFKTTNADRQ